MTIHDSTPLTTKPTIRQMELRGVRVHNLKNLDLDIPLNHLVVVSGVSGSGKSSLAFETLYREGQRRYIEGFSASARKQLEQIERPDADRIAHVPVAVAVRSDRIRRNRLDSRSTVASVADLLDGFQILFSRLGQIKCPNCESDVKANSAIDVVRAIGALSDGIRCQIAFAANQETENDPVATWLARGFSRAIWGGATRDLSTRVDWPKANDAWIIVDRIVAGKASSDRILESVETAFREGEGRCNLLVEAGQSPDTDTSVVDGRPWRIVPFSRRLECMRCLRQFLPIEPRLFSHFLSGACPTCRGTGLSISSRSGHELCDDCRGTRLRDEARAVRVAGRSFPELCQLTVSEAGDYVRELHQVLTADEIKLTELIRADLLHRLDAVHDLGLEYLTLDRSAGSLSGGEDRRLKLAAVIGSRMTGTLVVVDEPSAGLTEVELPGVIAALRRVKSQHNSVVVVDHSPLIVAAADHVIELGPAAGPSGGNVVYQGRPKIVDAIIDSASTQRSRTVDVDLAREFSSAQSTNTQLVISTLPRHANQLAIMTLKTVNHHNLHDFQVDFPLNRLCVVTGRGGSGKTSLVTQVLFPAVCKRLGLPCETSSVGKCALSDVSTLSDVVLVDQSPLTSSSRSNPAIWLDVFDEIRQTFAATIDARQRGFTSQSFSFNSSSGGRCRSCMGTGLLKHDMQFLPDITLVCPECHGTRYRQDILDVKYRGRSIADVLAMSVSEATVFFRSQQRIQSRFRLLEQIGLDYLVLGQPSETLSGGEAQRLKLAARLIVPAQGHCLIICDEPTTGLHPKDVERLVVCFRELIANGHSVVVADNCEELLARADYVVELGSKN